MSKDFIKPQKNLPKWVLKTVINQMVYLKHNYIDEMLDGSPLITVGVHYA